MFIIESNIPVPARAAGGKTLYPFAAMQVGDSFLATPGATVSAADRRRLAAATAAYARRNPGAGVKFAVRTTEQGLRVWRVA